MSIFKQDEVKLLVNIYERGKGVYIERGANKIVKYIGGIGPIDYVVFQKLKNKTPLIFSKVEFKQKVEFHLTDYIKSKIFNDWVIKSPTNKKDE
jgi:hypothetical protein